MRPTKGVSQIFQCNKTFLPAVVAKPVEVFASYVLFRPLRERRLDFFQIQREEVLLELLTLAVVKVDNITGLRSLRARECVCVCVHITRASAAVPLITSTVILSVGFFCFSFSALSSVFSAVSSSIFVLSCCSIFYPFDVFCHLLLKRFDGFQDVVNGQQAALSNVRVYLGVFKQNKGIIEFSRLLYLAQSSCFFFDDDEMFSLFSARHLKKALWP